GGPGGGTTRPGPCASPAGAQPGSEPEPFGPGSPGLPGGLKPAPPTARRRGKPGATLPGHGPGAQTAHSNRKPRTGRGPGERLPGPPEISIRGQEHPGCSPVGSKASRSSIVSPPANNAQLEAGRRTRWILALEAARGLGAADRAEQGYVRPRRLGDPQLSGAEKSLARASCPVVERICFSRGR